MYHLIVNGFSRFPRLRQRARGESDWSAEDAYSMAPDPTSNFLESRVCYAPVLFFFSFGLLIINTVRYHHVSFLLVLSNSTRLTAQPC